MLWQQGTERGQDNFNIAEGEHTVGRLRCAEVAHTRAGRSSLKPLRLSQGRVALGRLSAAERRGADLLFWMRAGVLLY